MTHLLNLVTCRPIEELLKTSEILKGVEAQRLRLHCTSISLIPSEHFDDLAFDISTGNLEKVQEDFESRVKRLSENEGQVDEATARSSAAKEISELTWGPTGVRVYNLIGLGLLMFDGMREKQLSVARWLSTEAKIPVDGADLSGSTALFHSISTHPAFEPELAQILYDAGADVNTRNRYGATTAHEICMIADSSRTGLKKMEDALRWFVTHGGNLDIKDSDKCTPRSVLGMTTAMIGKTDGARIKKVVEAEDKRRNGRKDACCSFCGREDLKLLRCGRCRKAGYCEPSKGRACQKASLDSSLSTPKHTPNILRCTGRLATPQSRMQDSIGNDCGWHKVGGMHLSQEAFSGPDCSLAMLLCDWTNIYVHQQVPRDSLRKTQRECSRLHDVCTLNLQATYIGSYETRYPNLQAPR